VDALPPLRLPGEHFAAGTVWLLFGAAGLVLVAPDLAWGRFLAPRVVAVTHCFTLGWITTVIFGALYQIFPVALGAPARSVAAGHAGFVVLTAGVAALVIGSWVWRAWLLAAAWGLLVAAVGIWSWNLLSRRRRARRNQLLGRYVAAGHVGLGLAMAVVAARIGASLGWWTVERLGVLAAHVHLAAIGFASLTAFGVSSRLLPMFLLSQEPPRRPFHWVGPLAGAGAALLALGHLTAVGLLTALGGSLAAVGVALYLAAAARWYARRGARRLDPGLTLVALALLNLGLAAGVGLVLLTVPSRAGWLAAYAILGIVGWLSLLVIGVSYWILPFLSRMHARRASQGTTGDRAGVARGPSWRDGSGPRRVAWTSVALLGGGVPGLAGAVAAGDADLARAAAWVFAAGVVLVVAHHGSLLVPVAMERPGARDGSSPASA
jgi:hypothetical protein